MATCHTLSKPHTKALAADIGKWLGKHGKPAEKGHRLGESFEVWYLPIPPMPELLTGPISEQCKDTGHLHHQIYRAGKVKYFAISARKSDSQEAPVVTGLMVSDRMTLIHHSAAWLDSKVLEEATVRLLHVPVLAILAFWVVASTGSHFLILDGPVQLVGRLNSEERTLLSEDEFAKVLRVNT